MKANEFDKWFEGEMPNSHKKVNKERIETIIYSCAEASWDFQQTKIDDSENTRAVLYRENMDLREKNIDLQSKTDELQEQLRIEREQGTEYFTDTHSLIAERDELQGRIDEAMKYVSESPLKDVSRRAMINFMDILKGNKDENN